MLEPHTKEIDTIDTAAMKRAKKRTILRRRNRSAALGRPAMKLLGGGGGGGGGRGGGFNKSVSALIEHKTLSFFTNKLNSKA